MSAVSVYKIDRALFIFKEEHQLWIGRSMIEGLEQWFGFFVSFRSPTWTFTRRIKAIVPSAISTTRPSCHWFLGSVSSLMMTISFTFKLRQGTCHFCRLDVSGGTLSSTGSRTVRLNIVLCTIVRAAYISSFTKLSGRW